MSTSDSRLSLLSSPLRRNAYDDDEDGDSSQNESQQMKGAVHSHLEKSIRPYIDLIDNLRSVGIQQDLALPTIAVIGDQSSGKSSVLEALSGVALPRGSGIVTRCPLELRLKKVTGGVNWKAVLSYRKKRIEVVDSSFVAGPIKPSKLANGMEHSTYEWEKFVFGDPSLVEEHVTAAQNELAGKGVGICDELITLEVMSPDVCDLTLIDLPGIARVPVKGQPQDIGKQIKHLIMKFIEKQETINLVVVPCNTDIATTEALKMAQEVDPEGRRTVAILTKPDLIDRGTEKDILDIVHNKVIPLGKGYTMVKCRGQQQINEKIPLEEATQIERDFFQNHDHFRDLLNKGKATIKCLAVKLTQNLVDHIKKSLPKLNQQITDKLLKVKNELKEYEIGPPEDLKGAKHFLIETLKRFCDQINSLSSGEQMSEENLFVQLRAEFKKWNDHLNSTKTPFSNSKELSQNNRGRELLGFSNYRLFESVLQKHVANLKKPAVELLNVIKDIIITHLTDVASQCFRNYTVLQNTAKDKINNIQLTQQEKTEKRILEQFEIENMVYTQDPIYLKFLSEITNETFSEHQLPIFDKECTYSNMMESYYEIVVQRMADQLPMMILFFMLKETAQLLSTDMLSLLDGANVRELLFEDSEVSRRRKDLREQRDRLSAAQEAFTNFSTD
ncbi:interferon-induced GTP-binding protein Mx3-like isoform X2 [Siphateles boraxobius]|uniref:interferon-induced GTP-binding protein Mx3-like isoform X2 n=1 Tax=Siphateles boraxobius TaxID=180520 RepID=UPI0040643BF0